MRGPTSAVRWTIRPSDGWERGTKRGSGQNQVARLLEGPQEEPDGNGERGKAHQCPQKCGRLNLGGEQEERNGKSLKNSFGVFRHARESISQGDRRKIQ